MLTGGGIFTAVFGDLTPPTIQQFGLFYPGEISWSSEVKLSATYSDNLQIDPASVKLKIDGQNITSGVSASPYSLWYSTNLSLGSHTLELTLSDAVGNINTSKQSITVLPLEFGLPILVAILLIGLILISRKRTHPQISEQVSTVVK